MRNARKRNSLAASFLVAAIGVSPQVAGAQETDLHAQWDVLLDAYITQSDDGVNRFDYARLAASDDDQAALQAYIGALEATPVSTLDRDAQYAFWANAYNALTVELIVENWPVDSIRQIKPHPFSIGPWRMTVATFEGVEMSLDDIEHETLREDWSDPRVHYAVNCASIGCPNLQTRAFRAETLDAQLDAGAIAYVNDPRGVTVVGDGRVEVSRIYKWFREDFGDSNEGVLEHLRAYAQDDLKAQLEDARIVGHAYDWAINAPLETSQEDRGS